MKGQKEAVIELVMACLPSFQPGDVALVMLTKDQLEDIKRQIGTDICNGLIEYSKAPDFSDAYPYARSMVMNHLKKAKELNGNQTYGKTTAQVKATAQDKALKDIDMSVLPTDLSEFVKTLV